MDIFKEHPPTEEQLNLIIEELKGERKKINKFEFGDGYLYVSDDANMTYFEGFEDKIPVPYNLDCDDLLTQINQYKKPITQSEDNLPVIMHGTKIKHRDFKPLFYHLAFYLIVLYLIGKPACIYAVALTVGINLFYKIFFKIKRKNL